MANSNRTRTAGSDAGQVVWAPLPPYEKPSTEAARLKKLEHARMLTWLEATLGTAVVPAETIYDAGKEQRFSKNKLIAARRAGGAHVQVRLRPRGGLDVDN